MMRLVDELVEHERERREKNHDGGEAQHDAFDQVNTQVRADLKLHERQRGEPEQRGHRARRDGAH